MNLKQCIKESGKRAYIVAAEIGVSIAALSLWASGDRIPNKENMQKLLSHFDDLDPSSFYE